MGCADLQGLAGYKSGRRGCSFLPSACKGTRHVGFCFELAARQVPAGFGGGERGSARLCRFCRVFPASSSYLSTAGMLKPEAPNIQPGWGLPRPSRSWASMSPGDLDQGPPVVTDLPDPCIGHISSSPSICPGSTFPPQFGRGLVEPLGDRAVVVSLEGDGEDGTLTRLTPLQRGMDCGLCLLQRNRASHLRAHHSCPAPTRAPPFFEWELAGSDHGFSDILFARFMRSRCAITNREQQRRTSSHEGRWKVKRWFLQVLSWW